MWCAVTRVPTSADGNLLQPAVFLNNGLLLESEETYGAVAATRLDDITLVGDAVPTRLVWNLGCVRVHGWCRRVLVLPISDAMGVCVCLYVRVYACVCGCLYVRVCRLRLFGPLKFLITCPELCSPDLERRIAASRDYVAARMADCDLCAVGFDDFGTDEIKALKISPDAFMQMAIQLAHFRLHKVCDVMM